MRRWVEDDGVVWIPVSTELLKMLSEKWSEPVRIMVKDGELWFQNAAMWSDK